MGVYAADGSWNVRIVDGTTYTGLYASDGSYNVFQRTTQAGAYHPCGALLVTPVVAATTRYAASGALNVSVSPYVQGAQRVTIISGAFV